MRVQYTGGDELRYRVRGHVGTVDQPAAEGGGDGGPTPVELFVASIVTCMGHYAQRFLRRNDVDPEGLALSATFSMAGKPARVGNIDVELTLPDGVPERLVAPIERVMHGCTIHNSLREPPAIVVRFSQKRSAA